MMKQALRLFVSITLAVSAAIISSAQWQRQASGTTADFRGLSAVNSQVAWASGTKGTFARTTDGGKTWQAGTVPGAEQLDFRDIDAFDANTAYMLSIGKGESSRIYKTTDGGQHWLLQFRNSNPEAFFDAMAFWDAHHGIAFSDPVDGRFLIITTGNGGKTWTPVPPANIPPAIQGEGGFAASGTCIAVQGSNNVWFGTGGAAARVFRSTDRGRTWSVAATPILSGIESAGIFSVAFKDAKNGIVVGGDYRKPNEADRNVAVTADGGQTWKLIAGTRPAGYRSCVAYIPGEGGMRLIAVGTSGSDYSTSGGADWIPLDRENYNVVSLAGRHAGWAAGPGGRIVRFMDDK
ncbi:MAG TPA: glycosyl hydrolase [Blastocatellia bacterium]|nr:glycosyl hydrolase [Blastocatellia bacterium]